MRTDEVPVEFWVVMGVLWALLIVAVCLRVFWPIGV
jgi:hypothetical protein